MGVNWLAREEGRGRREGFGERGRGGLYRAPREERMRICRDKEGGECNTEGG